MKGEGKWSGGEERRGEEEERPSTQKVKIRIKKREYDQDRRRRIMYMCDSTVDGGRAYGTLFAFLGRSSAEICIPEMLPCPVALYSRAYFGITFRSLWFSGLNNQQTIK